MNASQINLANGPKTPPKTYWTILKTFVNGTGSKIPQMPPPLVDNKLVTEFFDKVTQ